MRKRLVLLSCVMLLVSSSAFALKKRCSTCVATSCWNVSSGYLLCEQGPNYCSAGGGDCESTGAAVKAASVAPSMPRWQAVQASVRHIAPVSEAR